MAVIIGFPRLVAATAVTGTEAALMPYVVIRRM